MQSFFSLNRDTVLVAVPFFFMLLVSVFRLDRIIAAPKVPLSRRRPRCGIDASGEPLLRDPDGRLSESRRKGKLNR